MRNASGHQSKNERQRKKVNRPTYNISSIRRVTRKFLEVSRCRRAKQRQRNVQKSVLHVKVVFLLIRPIAFFFAVFVAVGAWLALHDFIFCSFNYRY